MCMSNKDFYKNKYLKYKSKYLDLLGGVPAYLVVKKKNLKKADEFSS